MPFLASAVLVGIGLWVRLKLAETPAFAAVLKRESAGALPVGARAARPSCAHRLPARSAGSRASRSFYLATAFALGYGTATLGYPRETVPAVQLGAILFMALGIVLAGIYCDRWNPRRRADRRLPHRRRARGLADGADDGERLASASCSPTCRSRLL